GPDGPPASGSTRSFGRRPGGPRRRGPGHARLPEEPSDGLLSLAAAARLGSPAPAPSPPYLDPEEEHRPGADGSPSSGRPVGAGTREPADLGQHQPERESDPDRAAREGTGHAGPDAPARPGGADPPLHRDVDQRRDCRGPWGQRGGREGSPLPGP